MYPRSLRGAAIAIGPRERARIFRSAACLFACAALLLGAEPLAPIKIAVDAREAQRSIFHARLMIPAKPGPLTLLYPKWIPGEHGPTGPITNLAGLELTAAGKRIPWRRDPVEMYAFHCDVPEGAAAVEVTLDFLSPVGAPGFSAGGSTSDKLAVVSWNQVLLYPQGRPTSELMYEASLRLPSGWKYGTALPVAKESGGAIEFAPVSLNMLVDSPVLSGMYFRKIPLTTVHEIDLAADSEAALAMDARTIDAYKRLAAEAGALFGARHYTSYRFLVTLSDHVAHFGLEHHQSSDNRTGERTFIDPDLRKLTAGLLPHEFVHSWNGKYRRPADLTTPNFEVPMRTDLLWVYEGLTTYLSGVLTARSGLWSPEEFREDLALESAILNNEPGREWRSLEDTAVAAQLLYAAPEAWSSWRRGVDFYTEGALLWLEADTIIRRVSGGRRSLDDFCRSFFGGSSGPPAVVTYNFDDLTAALNGVVPYDWNGFFRTRLTRTGRGAPLGGIVESGWRLAYTEAPNKFMKGQDGDEKTTDLSYSIGLRLGEDGMVMDAIRGMPAAEAGIAPGMKVTAVNGRRCSPEVLREAVKATKNGPGVLELLVSNNGYFDTYKVHYKGGEKYPHLERDASKPDLLSDILKPLTISETRRR